MANEALVIVTAGNRRYAVAQRHVAGLQRVAETTALMSLAALLGEPTTALLPYALDVAGVDRAILVQSADLRAQMARLPLPGWVAAQAHPAVVGLALDDTELVPIVDLVQLAQNTGNTAP